MYQLVKNDFVYLTSTPYTWNARDGSGVQNPRWAATVRTEPLALRSRRPGDRSGLFSASGCAHEAVGVREMVR
jgi:hypothetical protein